MKNDSNFRSLLPKYELIERVYKGYKSEVYRGLRRADRQPVVIKILRQEYPTFSDLLHFRNQYTIGQNLAIVGIVRPLCLENYQHSYALVMEDFGGISLREYVKFYPLELAEFLTVAVELADILHYLYQNHVIHKDIKPANILINPETKQVKLIDFSIASLLSKEISEIKNSLVLEGTIAYISPEQTGRMNRGIDYRSDLYSLGVTFFELLAGHLPFISDDFMELVHCHIAKNPPPLGASEQIPAVLSDLVMKLMAKNAEDRYQSALGLKYDLQKCLKQWQETGKIEQFELGQRDICDRFIIPEKLYGRETEVQQLLEAFERVANPTTKKEGRGVELMLVAGFSGIGKTAVINEVHKPIVRQRGYFIKGKFDQFNRNIPFSAFVQAFRNLMGQLLSESDAQIPVWKTKIQSALGDSAQVIIDVIPELESIIGKQPSVPELSGVASQNRFHVLFHNFLSLFSTKDHPLVIFLDDLQWVDSASLDLMKLLMSESKSGSLLLIGAYRDNEVSLAHPLMLTINEISKTGATINTITLAPLSHRSLNQLVADTLNCNPHAAQPLTELLAQKTKGNPFFTTQFFKALYQDGLITFNSKAGYWECDIIKVREQALTEDVVEFMAQQLQKLSPETQAVLKLAACIGNQFDLNTLAIVSEQSETATAIALWKALEEGLILPTSEMYKFYLDDSHFVRNAEPSTLIYKFLHDRVQQAAYSLIPEAQKQITHLKIGQLLLNHASGEEQEAKLFEIVNQLNIGKSLIAEPSEQTQLAQLNLQATQKARSATAYTAGFQYATTGISLLAVDRWTAQYQLTRLLYEAATETAYLSGNTEQVAAFIPVILEHARTIFDTVKVYEIQIQAAQAQHNFLEAVQIAIKILEPLGTSFPQQPSQSDIAQAFDITNSLLDGRQPPDLMVLPEMTEPHKLAAMRILSGVSASAFVAAPALLPFIILEQVNLSLQYGNTSFSTKGYAYYGLMLCGVAGDIDTGYQFGQLAIALLQQLNAKEQKAATYVGVNCSVLHWKEPLRNTLPYFREGYQSGLETGDLESATICAFGYVMHSWLAGAELGDLGRESAAFSVQLTQLNQAGLLSHLTIFQQAIVNLMGDCSEPWQLRGNAFNQEQTLPEIYKAGDQTALCYFHISKLLLCYLFGKLELAVTVAIAAENHLSGATGLFVVPIFHTYDSLAHLAIYSHVSELEQLQILQRVTHNQEKMKKWADHAPVNHLHKFDLVEAERYRILGQKLEAIEYYDRAIALAKEHQFLNEEALANELCAKFYLEWGKEKVAQTYMTEAYYCYARWGAKAKVENLETCYPELLQQILLQSTQTSLNLLATLTSINHSSTQASSSSISDTLDFASVIQAAQTLSSEIQLNELLKQLTQIILQNAGADKCVLILPLDKIWVVRAISTIEATELCSEALENSPDVPIQLIQYVRRTQSVVVINNLETDLPVIDNYLIQYQPKSILCLPILNQGNLVGILYLKNQKTKGVFTRSRLMVIEFLCTQAAISLENARLYHQSQAYAQELEHSQLQVIQSEKMSALGNLVAGVAHEINNPIGFLGGNIQPALDYVRDLFSIIDLYQQKYPERDLDMEAEIDNLDLDYIRQDLPKLLGSMHEGVKRIRDISTSLRTFSRADTDRPVACNIHDGIDSTIMILKHRLKASETRPEIQVIKNYGILPQVECYVGQLNQVFMNLLANAIDALDESNQGRAYEEIRSRPNQIRITTELSADRQALIRIQDNGKGMTEEVKQKIFDHLFTTKAVGKGTGLGLAIARQIVGEKHGGKITVNSDPMEGTEFTIAIPVTS